MRLHDLLDGLDVVELRDSSEVDVRAVVHDSREAGPGALFCCIRGAVTDGHLHAADAVAAGASALLVERFVEASVPQARVNSVRRALGPLASRFYGEPSRQLRVLGVTGTNGKTTTVFLIDAIARAAGEVTGFVGTVETRIAGRSIPAGRTTPEATDLQRVLAEMRAAGVRTASMEVSSHALAQRRVDSTWFAAACFTNLSHDHLDFHGTLDAYYEAKARLFTPEFTNEAVVGIDDPHGRLLMAQALSEGLHVTTFGVDSNDARMATRDVWLAADRSEFTLVDVEAAEACRCVTPLVGPFNVANALAAAAAARAAGFDTESIVAGLATVESVPGRMERVDAGQDFMVLVDYAHTPDALARVLAAARALADPGARVLAVFGCGGDRDRAKRPLMGEAAEVLADVAVLTSDNPRSEDPERIAADVLAGVSRRSAMVVELDRRAAIRCALQSARAGDVVVVAGKGHESGQTAAGITTPFDDRAVAREELEAHRCR